MDDEVKRMAAALRQYLSLADRQFIVDVDASDGERLFALVSTRAGNSMTGRDFAAFLLSCAKRVRAGGPT